MDVGVEQGMDDEARQDRGGMAQDDGMKLEKNDLIRESKGPAIL